MDFSIYEDFYMSIDDINSNRIKAAKIEYNIDLDRNDMLRSCI